MTLSADTLAPGTYWVAMRADADDTVAESDETDNLTEWVQVTVEEPVADLRLDAATLGAATDLDLDGGGRLNITYDWANAGKILPSSFTIQSYLSTDAEVSADDLRVLGITGGTVPGQSSTISTDYYLSESFAPGAYFLISEISWGDGTPDATDDNRIVQQITLTPPPADLALSGLTLDATSDLFAGENGIRLEGTVTVENLSSVSVGGTVTASLSADGTLSADDIAIDLGSVTLTSGASTVVALDARLVDPLDVGVYTLFVALDGSDDDAGNAVVSIEIMAARASMRSIFPANPRAFTCAPGSMIQTF